MAARHEWTYSKRVEESNDREVLLPKLLQNGWEPTEAIDGIRKAFTFATVADAVDFHTLVSTSSIKNRHHALLQLEGKIVSVEWTTHQPTPKGLSGLDCNMARICDTIAGVLNNDERVWEELRTKYSHVHDIPTQNFYFRYHSYVIDFVRAMGVVAKADPGSIRFHSKPRCVGLIRLKEDIRLKLAFWLAFVKESVINLEKSIDNYTAIEGEQRVFQFDSVDGALNFHTLVHRCFLCKKFPVESFCEDKSVTVKSPSVEGMKMCDPIADALSGKMGSCRSSVGDDDIPPVLHFANHSKVAIFVRAVVIASRSAGPSSVTSDYTGVKLNGKSEMDTDLTDWLKFVLQNVVKRDPEDKVEKCGSSL